MCLAAHMLIYTFMTAAQGRCPFLLEPNGSYCIAFPIFLPCTRTYRPAVPRDDAVLRPGRPQYSYIATLVTSSLGEHMLLGHDKAGGPSRVGLSRQMLTLYS